MVPPVLLEPLARSNIPTTQSAGLAKEIGVDYGYEGGSRSPASASFWVLDIPELRIKSADVCFGGDIPLVPARYHLGRCFILS